MKTWLLLFTIVIFPQLIVGQSISLSGTMTWTGTSTSTSIINGGGSSTENGYCTTSGTWIGPATDGPASLPTGCNNTAISNTPSPGTVRGPDSGTSAVQNDINAAGCGDVIKVTAGSSIGGITLPGKGCDDAHWITIESTGISNSNFPAEGVRMTPCWANISSLPNRPAYPCSSPANLLFKITGPTAGSAIVANGADHYRIIGAEIARPTIAGTTVYFLVDLSGASPAASKIIFDRVWAHGVNQDGNFPLNSGTDTATVRAFYLGQANHFSLINSYVSDFYVDGSVSASTDAQAISGGYGSTVGSGWGVYKVYNNHLEGSTEGILMGGSIGPALQPPGCTVLVNCNLDVPTDFEVRSNYFFKSPGWISPSGTTTGWPVVKNGFEMKIGARALFEGNVVENTWPDAQPGYAFSIAPKNQSGGSPLTGQAPTALTNDFTYRYNYAYNVAYGIGLYSSQDAGCSTCQSQGANRISIHDNLIDYLHVLSQYTGGGDANEFVANAGSPIQNVLISHNTTTNAVRSMILFSAPDSTTLASWTIQNNIWPQGTYGIDAAGGVCDNPFGASNNAFGLLNACMTAYTFSYNAIFNATMSPLGKNYPTNGSGAGNFFYSSATGFGFTNYNNGNSNFTPANYQLTSGSPLHNAGTDGKDLGVDISGLSARIAGVRE